MYIHRTRPKYSDEELREIYGLRYDHTRWEDHIFRVAKTIEFGKTMFEEEYPRPTGVVDLSCGDGSIAKALDENPTLGDYTPGYQYQGPIEETIKNLPHHTCAALVMTETMEHLDNPFQVLQEAKRRLDFLLLSTPVHRLGEVDENEQHYWCYDREGVELFLQAAYWEVSEYEEIYAGIGYRYGLWWCW